MVHSVRRRLTLKSPTGSPMYDLENATTMLGKFHDSKYNDDITQTLEKLLLDKHAEITYSYSNSDAPMELLVHIAASFSTIVLTGETRMVSRMYRDYKARCCGPYTPIICAPLSNLADCGEFVREFPKVHIPKDEHELILNCGIGDFVNHKYQRQTNWQYRFADDVIKIGNRLNMATVSFYQTIQWGYFQPILPPITREIKPKKEKHNVQKSRDNNKYAI